MQDVVMLRQWIANGEAGEERKRVETAKLDALLALTELTSCRRQRLLAYFGEADAAPCGNCDNCLAPPATVDGTEAARKALSAIYRTGERFGAGYVIAVLRGEGDERVGKNGHDRLPVFGIGRNMDEAEWKGLFRQLAVQGMIETDVERHGALRLLPSCRPLLRGETTFELRKEARVPAGKRQERTRSSRTGKTAGPPVAAGDEPLLTALRALRSKLAADGNVPPYVIFHDRTLHELADKKPLSAGALHGITGMGDVKISRYGSAIVEVMLQLVGPK
jgi:ATP-dependent DNA helicase RecQ